MPDQITEYDVVPPLPRQDYYGGASVENEPAIPASPLSKLEALVTLRGGAQVWVRFNSHGTPLADLRPHIHATWTPISMCGGSVEVAP